MVVKNKTITFTTEMKRKFRSLSTRPLNALADSAREMGKGRFDVSLEAMHQVNELVANATNNMGMDEKSARQIRLIVEEAVGNVINYSDATTMSLSIDEQEDGLMITVTDDGKPFDPTTMPPPDLSIPGTERAIGGLGIHYMRQMSDSMTYQRKENKNVLRMIKKKM